MNAYNDFTWLELMIYSESVNLFLVAVGLLAIYLIYGDPFSGGR